MKHLVYLLLNPAFTNVLEGNKMERPYRGLSFLSMFPWVERFLCTMGWHWSIGTIVLSSAYFTCLSLFASYHLPKKMQEFCTVHSSSLSKQPHYSVKIPLIWKCLNKWNSGLLTSLRRTVNFFLGNFQLLLTVLVPFFYFRAIWYNSAQLLALHTHTASFEIRELCLRCRPSTSSDFKKNLHASEDNIWIKETDVRDTKIRCCAQLCIC